MNICLYCQSNNIGVHSKATDQNNARYKCYDCGKTFTGHKPGRKPIGDRPMTATERSRKHRKKLKAKNNAVK